MSAPTIGILMPIFNGIEFIDESVTSVLRQTHTNWSLLIGINGHSIGSDVYRRALEYETHPIANGRIRVVDLGPLVSGKTVALNAMVSLLAQPIQHVALLDVDDAWLPNKLVVQLPHIHTHQVVGTRCRYMGSKNSIPTIPIGKVGDAEFFSTNPIINSSAIIRRSLCHWSSDWEGVDDYELWLRIHHEHPDASFYNCNDVVVKHRLHGASAFNGKNRKKSVDVVSHYKKLK